MPDDLSRTEFHSVIALFHEAERALKFVELDQNEGTVVPAINELRYAGYHICKAIEATNPKERAEEIDKAEKHCKRAKFDALEFGILDQLERFKIFQDDYRLVVISGIVPDYTDIRLKAIDIQDFIDRVDRSDRDNHHERCKEYFEEFRLLVRKLDAARPELNKKLRNTRWGAFATAAGVVIALLTLFFGFFQVYSKTP